MSTIKYISLKKRLIISRKLSKDSDFEVYEDVFEFENTYNTLRLVEILFHGFDDNTENYEIQNSLLNYIIRILKNYSVNEQLQVIVTNRSCFYPHAKKWFLSFLCKYILEKDNLSNVFDIFQKYISIKETIKILNDLKIFTDDLPFEEIKYNLQYLIEEMNTKISNYNL